jgi:hypothetical protein
MPNAPVKAPVTTEINPAWLTDKSGCDIAHSKQRMYMIVVTNIIKRGRIFQSSKTVCAIYLPTFLQKQQNFLKLSTGSSSQAFNYKLKALIEQAYNLYVFHLPLALLFT